MKLASRKLATKNPYYGDWKKSFIQSRYLYLLMIPAILYMVLISYRTMYGILLAFKDYDPKLVIMASEWVGLKHFKNMFSDPYFRYVLLNTIRISISKTIIEFPFPIILAVCFSELRGKRFKKVLQTVYTFPHFLSWVICAGIIINFLDYSGPLNRVLYILGFERQVFLGSKVLIRPILYVTDIWKSAGWGSIVYMAAIAGINPELYEAAELDGATRFRKIWHVTLPCIRGLILIMLTMKVGGILSAGFGQIFNLSNTVVQRTIDILDTYIYRVSFLQKPDFAYSTALTFFQVIVGFALVMVTNTITKKLEGTGLFE